MEPGLLRKAEFEDSNVNQFSILLSKIEELDKRVNELEQNKKPKLSIIIENYKKSIIIKNKYDDKFTTLGYKEKLKELGGKWTKSETNTGWIFVGKHTESTLEKSSQFIIQEFIDNTNFEYTINEI